MASANNVKFQKSFYDLNLEQYRKKYKTGAQNYGYLPRWNMS